MGKAIGIDLGTTNSCVCIVDNGRPVIIPNENGKRTTPSVVAFAKDGSLLVGETALNQAIVNRERTAIHPIQLHISLYALPSLLSSRFNHRLHS